MEKKQPAFAGSARAVLALALSLGIAVTGAHAHNQKDKHAAKAASAKKAPPGKVKFLPGTQESAKERATRLKRECKGAVNAGACLGHTG